MGKLSLKFASAALAVSLSLFLVVSGCEHKKGVAPGNLQPGVQLSAGPSEGGSEYYAVLFRWFGWDMDGYIDHFEYAIDDTTSWTETRFHEGSFLFRADSLRPGGYMGRWHTFYLKAVDDFGLGSPVEDVTFDATTIAPSAAISTPRCNYESYPCQGAMAVSTSFKVVWTGRDLDSRSPTKMPVAYTWRLFNTSLINPLMGVEDDSLLLRTPDGAIDPTSRWSAPTSQTLLQFQNLAPGVFWQFAVRAIDEAGSVEPGLRMNRNVIFFKPMPIVMAPKLTVYESYVPFTFPDNGQVWEKEAAVRAALTFNWRGDANLYGGTITGYIYGVDIDDLSDPDQWEGDWNRTVTTATVRFDTPGPHYVYVKVKDNADTETLGTIKLEIIDFEFDQGILYVDDYFDIIPTDATHDGVRDAFLACVRAVCGTVHVYNCCMAGPDGTPPELPDIVLYPSLSQLSHFRLVIWDVDATRNSFKSGLWGALQNYVLQPYLRGGGSIWLFGVSTLRGSMQNPWTFEYGRAPEWGSVPAVFFKVTGAVNMAPFLNYSTRADGFRGAWPNREAVGDRFPCLDSLDYSLGGIDIAYGMPRVEVITTAMQDPDVSQRPDTVYFYRANYSTSRFNMKACGLRYYDPVNGSKVVWMGFPIHYFFTPKGESLVCAVVDWVYGGES